MIEIRKPNKHYRTDTKPSVQCSTGIFQLIDQIETAVDKLLERQVNLDQRNKTGSHWMDPTDVTGDNSLFYLLCRFRKISLTPGSLNI
jgi:hypothetical protein